MVNPSGKVKEPAHLGAMPSRDQASLRGRTLLQRLFHSHLARKTQGEPWKIDHEDSDDREIEYRIDTYRSF